MVNLQGIRILPALEQFLTPLASLREDPDNPYIHPQRQIQDIADSFRAFGVDTAVVYRADGILVAGAGRIKAARFLGMTHFPAVPTTLTPREARRRLIGDNRLPQLAGLDERKLRRVLADLMTEDGLLAGTGYDVQMVQGFLDQAVLAAEALDLNLAVSASQAALSPASFRFEGSRVPEVEYTDATGAPAPVLDEWQPTEWDDVSDDPDSPACVTSVTLGAPPAPYRVNAARVAAPTEEAPRPAPRPRHLVRCPKCGMDFDPFRVNPRLARED